MPDYLEEEQMDVKKGEVIKMAVGYFWELIKQNQTKERAKKIVLQKTGVVL